jgi:arylsulfatase B
VLKAIEKSGRAENTIVVFHSDNGGDPRQGGRNTPLRGRKFTTWEGGVRVVAMIRWPARFKGGRRFTEPLAYIDLLPTLVHAAGQTVPPDVDGVNFLPALLDGTPLPERTLLLGEDTAISGPWKLKGEELFDLVNDPNEQVDLAANRHETVARLRGELARFQKLAGPKFETALPKPAQWPPAEWKLPEER